MMLPNHDFTATLQFGIVSAVDEAAHNLRVRLPSLENMETDWLPMITPAAGGNRFYSLPDEGEQVVCLLDARGENGVVLGATYNTADKPPAASKDVWMRRFKNGTVIKHDRKTGNIDVQTQGTVTIAAPDTIITGNTTVMGLLTYQGGMSGSGGAGAAAVIDGAVQATGVISSDSDVTANGISLTGHTHTGDSGGATGTPN
ncbi:phage baseplate assembly protein V [Neisseria weaveri]|uniref:Putative phage-related baseplate assembly protein n=1 Tax=Neisseria weaveri TaxID=28091 RepID=A0A3S5C9P1_9NEIS|nr:phage baseplate assembly protein V [Neisseria weaveri]EGV38458.1 putative phage-related baseplate assembly protein [Neisseria weaveri LMG 5135]VEJ49984.1 putative phage-related baseplate assembly protein [Neisseria weaveri]